jgi:hypothetical protein
MSKKKTTKASKQFSYIITIATNLALIYFVRNLPSWDIPFLTDDFSKCQWTIQLSLAVSIFINFIFIFLDRKWLTNLLQAFGNVFSFISGYIFWRVFPLNLAGNTERIVGLILIIALGGIVLSTVIELTSAVRNYNRKAV